MDSTTCLMGRCMSAIKDSEASLNYKIKLSTRCLSTRLHRKIPSWLMRPRRFSASTLLRLRAYQSQWSTFTFCSACSEDLTSTTSSNKPRVEVDWRKSICLTIKNQLAFTWPDSAQEKIKSTPSTLIKATVKRKQTKFYLKWVLLPNTCWQIQNRP